MWIRWSRIRSIITGYFDSNDLTDGLIIVVWRVISFILAGWYLVMYPSVSQVKALYYFAYFIIKIHTFWWLTDTLFFWCWTLAVYHLTFCLNPVICWEAEVSGLISSHSVKCLFYTVAANIFWCTKTCSGVMLASAMWNFDLSRKRKSPSLRV